MQRYYIFNKYGTRYFAKQYPPQINHTYNIKANRNGLKPALRNLSILVSAPNAVIAIVSKNVSKALMNDTRPAGNRLKELKPITTRNRTANHGIDICLPPTASSPCFAAALETE